MSKFNLIFPMAGESSRFNYQFNIKEEMFQIAKSEDSELIGKSSKILNYVAIEERQNCGVLNA